MWKWDLQRLVFVAPLQKDLCECDAKAEKCPISVDDLQPSWV